MTEDRATTEIKAMGFYPIGASNWSKGSTIEVSCEMGFEDGRETAGDYWQMFINPQLEDWADRHDLYWEWANPGVLAAYEI